MTTKKTMPTGISSFYKRHGVKLFTLTALIISLGFSLKTTATSITQQWTESHKGYSIEEIPGSSPVEYVAAGTIYDPVNWGITGWHFMRLDQFGNVLAERKSYSQVYGDFRYEVVDIAVEDSKKFWITVLARSIQTGLERDFVMAEGVDEWGTTLCTPCAGILLSSLDTNYTNLYPTHSYFADNGQLYICGYACKSETAYPLQPNTHYSDKLGFMMKVDVNGLPVTSSQTFWNTLTNDDNFDFDMPLRIVPSGYNVTFPLLVTGAGNCGQSGTSAVLAMKFDANTNILNSKTYMPVSYWTGTAPSEHAFGVYGVDIRGDIYGDGTHPGSADFVVLVNGFDDHFNNIKRTYGLMRLRPGFASYPFIPTYVERAGTNGQNIGWAKQFMELKSQPDPGGNMSKYQNSIYVAGEMFNTFCPNSIGLPNLAPSTWNVNPFFEGFNLSYPVWDATNGWNTPSTPFFTGTTGSIIHLSSKGTVSSTVNYWLSLGEKMQWIYTPVSLNHYYDNPSVSSPAVVYPALITPIGEWPTSGSNPYLNTKFIKTTTGYGEANCNNVYNDCKGIEVSAIYDVGLFEDVQIDVAIDGINHDNSFNNFPTMIDCSTGYYKTTGIGNVNSNKEFTFYPNPASKEINIGLPQQITNSDKVEFTLTDITGKTVYTNNEASTGYSIKYQLPNLAAGTYIGTIQLNGIKYSNKVTIK